MAFNLGGAAGGAASGAQMGSMFGPWGTAIGAVGGGLMGAFGGGRGEGQQYMSPQWLQNPEDAGAAGLRDYNRGYIQDVMEKFQSGVDPMQARADAQYQMEMDRIRRENLGTEGDRSSGIWNQALQTMTNTGGFNPAQVLAQKKKFLTGMQGQFDDVRSRIYGGATDWMRGSYLDAAKTSNTLREGPQGQWSAGMMGAAPENQAPDMAGIMSGFGKIADTGKELWGKYTSGKNPAVSPAGYASPSNSNMPYPAQSSSPFSMSTPSNIWSVTYPGVGSGPYQPKV